MIAPSELPIPYYPVAYISNYLQQEGWYRLATGGRNYNMNALISLGNAWGYNSQSACIFALLACNASIMIHKLNGYGNMSIDKIRYLQNPNNLISNTYIDIHYIYNKENVISISASAITNLVFVSSFELATIPEGYVATEVNL